MDLGLEGKVCVVTGASRGIGLEVARRLCSEGARVLLVARGADALERAAGECGDAEWLACDVTDPDAAGPTGGLDHIRGDCPCRFLACSATSGDTRCYR